MGGGEEKRAGEGGFLKLCLKNDVWRKSFVIVESGIEGRRNESEREEEAP